MPDHLNRMTEFASNTTGARRRALRITLGFGIAFLSSVAALAVIEGVVRIAGYGSDQLLRDDSVLGVRFIESKRGLSQSTCYHANVTVNSQGWRSPEFAQMKSDDVFRVLVLGDSFMAGLQVNDDEIFSSVLRQRLNDAGLGKRVEVITFGVPSWGTDQQYLALRQYGLKLNPDLVVVAFYAQNDVAETDLMLRSSTNTYPKPFFDLREGRLIELPFVDSTPMPIKVGRRIAADLRLYPMVRDSLLTFPLAHRVLFRFGIVGVVPQENESPEPEDPSLWQWPDRWRRQIGVFELRPWADWSRAWAISEALLNRMNAEATSTGARFLLLGVASPIEVMPQEILLGLIASRKGDFDADQPTRRLTEISARRGIDFVSMVPAFKNRIGNSAKIFEDLFLRCDGHWTPAGHRLAAELAAAEVVARVRLGRHDSVSREQAQRMNDLRTY